MSCRLELEQYVDQDVEEYEVGSYIDESDLHDPLERSRRGPLSRIVSLET